MPGIVDIKIRCCETKRMSSFCESENSSCYHTVPSAICKMFSEFFIFCNLFYEPLG